MATQPADDHESYCPAFHRVAELLGRRWAAVVLRVLALGPARFSTIRRNIPGLSDRLLAKRLGELVDEGIVHRCEKDGDACYGLSTKGHALIPALDAIDDVAHQLAHMAEPAPRISPALT